MTRRESLIQAELKQTRPFASRGQEALVALMRTTDLVKRRVAGIVEPHGITLQQYNVLRILRGAGVEGLPTIEVGSRMIEQTPGITRLLERLRKKGLIWRETCSQDRRRVLCGVTKRGLRVLAEIDGPLRQADTDCLGTLGDQELVRLVSLLDRVRSVGGRRGMRRARRVERVKIGRAAPGARQGERR